MSQETKVVTSIGWQHAVQQLAQEIDKVRDSKKAGEKLSDKSEVKALKKITKPAEATTEDIANAVNAIIAALKA